MSTPRHIAPPGSKATRSPVNQRFDEATEALRQLVGVLCDDDMFDAALREYKIARYELSNEIVGQLMPQPSARQKGEPDR